MIDSNFSLYNTKALDDSYPAARRKNNVMEQEKNIICQFLIGN